MSTDFLFVYGSLRKAHGSPASDVLKDYADYVGMATYRGKLYMIEWYPGVVPSADPEDQVLGELYKVNDKSRVFSKLDQYEGCAPSDPKPHAYVREQKSVIIDDSEVTAWIYLYNLSVSGKKEISSGDFLNH